MIIDVATDKSIAELDWRAAHTMLHEQAIYQHDAEQYQVERLDYENHKAFVRKVAPDYFTTALTYRTVQVIEEHETEPFGRTRIGFGDVKVEEKVTGYKKIKFFTHENAGYGDVHLPEMQMHTTAFWLTLPEAVIDSLGHPRATIVDGLRGLGARARDGQHAGADVRSSRHRPDPGRRRLRGRCRRAGIPSAAAPAASIRRCSCSTRSPAAWAWPSASTSGPGSSATALGR